MKCILETNRERKYKLTLVLKPFSENAQNTISLHKANIINNILSLQIILYGKGRKNLPLTLMDDYISKFLYLLYKV